MKRAPADGVLASIKLGAWTIQVLDGASPRRIELEHELLQRGVALGFASRAATAAMPEYRPSIFFAILDPDHACVGGFAAQARRAPLLRGHQLLRIENFGAAVPAHAVESAVSAVKHWARHDRRVLRVSVDVFSFDAARARELGRVLERHGFRRPEHVRGYTETLILDLAPAEAELFAELHHSARRKLRQLEKLPVTVRTIDDPGLSERMNALLRETFARTGADVEDRDWGARIAFAQDNPELSRTVGLFRNDVSGPDSLLAYAWGVRDGNHVYYSEAASTRSTGDLRVPVAYGVMWDLILWAKRTGAQTFDFGGVTHGSHSDDDPLGGISDFKRYFSQQVVHVRDEWILDDHSWRAVLAAAVHRRLRRR